MDNNKTFDKMYLEYLELKEAKEKAEEQVIRNQIRNTLIASEEKIKETMKELEEMDKKLNRIKY